MCEQKLPGDWRLHRTYSRRSSCASDTYILETQHASIIVVRYAFEVYQRLTLVVVRHGMASCVESQNGGKELSGSRTHLYSKTRLHKTIHTLLIVVSPYYPVFTTNIKTTG